MHSTAFFKTKPSSILLRLKSEQITEFCNLKKSNKAQNDNFSRSRPPAGQHPQKGTTSRSTATRSTSRSTSKGQRQKVNDNVNDIRYFHSHYKRNRTRGGAAERLGTFVATSKRSKATSKRHQTDVSSASKRRQCDIN